MEEESFDGKVLGNLLHGAILHHVLRFSRGFRHGWHESELSRSASKRPSRDRMRTRRGAVLYVLYATLYVLYAQLYVSAVCTVCLAVCAVCSAVCELYVLYVLQYVMYAQQ